MGLDRFNPVQLEEFAAAVFRHHAMPERHAGIAARSIVDGDLIGVSTHGLARLPSYVERLQRKLVKANPNLTAESGMPWSVRIDADNAMGAVAADFAVGHVRRMIDALGIGAAVVRGSNHFGTAGYHARNLAGDDCIGICLSPASKSLAPFGSREPLFGTNPWAVSVPAGRHPHWILDMATSVAARGHIRIAAREGRSIPEGWALDADGKPTTDPARALAGVMLPFAGPKGSGIAMMIDILGGVLSGSAFGGRIRDMNTDFEAPQDVGHFFMAFKIEAFMQPAEFGSRMEELIATMRRLKPAEGHTEITYPGELEWRRKQANLADGVPLSSVTIASLKKVGQDAKVEFPPAVRCWTA